MADNERKPATYWQARRARILSDWRATGNRMAWGVGVAAASAAVSALRKYRMGALDWEDILLSALYGGIAGPMIAGFVVLAWHWFRAPARIWADDQKTIVDLQNREKTEDYQLAQFELLLLQKGTSAERFDLAAEQIGAWKQEISNTGKSSATRKQVLYVKDIVSKDWPGRGIDPQPVRDSLNDLLEWLKKNSS